MIVGYLFVAMLAGSLATLIMLTCGASLIVAFGVYVSVGTFTLIVFPLMALLTGAYPRRRDASARQDRLAGKNEISLGAP